MSNKTETLTDHVRAGRDALKRKSPAARKGGGMLLGALALGVAGFFAWRNRDRIAQTAGPVIEDAKAKGRTALDKAAARSHDMMDEAAVRGHQLVDGARDRGQALAAKGRLRRPDAADSSALEVH